MNAPEHLTATAAGTYQRLFEARGELVALRRELHTMPELGFEEHRTAAQALVDLVDAAQPQRFGDTAGGPHLLETSSGWACRSRRNAINSGCQPASRW